MVNKMKSYVSRNFIVIFSISLSFLFRFFSPVIYVFNSPHDDLMAIRQAEGILEGKWLGEWSNLTLAKPPGYALFLVLSKVLRIQPEWLLWGFVLLTSYIAARGVAKILQLKSSYKTHLVFAVLILNPVFYGQDFSRIYRTSLYTALGFFFSAIFLHLISSLVDSPVKDDSNKIISFSTILFAILGTTYGLMSITRTEGLWVLIPSLIVGVLMLWRLSSLRKVGLKSIKLRKLVSGMLFMFVFATIPTTLISSANLTNYGVEVIEDFYSGPFAEAMLNWQSIVPEENYPPNISITKSMRKAAYEVSPAAESLRASLEGPAGAGWKYFNCNIGFPCDEAGSWAPWEIRDAAVQSLGIQSEKQFLDFFTTLSTEISSACQKELLKCRSKGTAPMLINLRYLDPSEIAVRSLNYFSSFPNMHQARFIQPADSAYTPELMEIWSKVVNVKLYNGDSSTATVVTQFVLKVLSKIYVVVQWFLIACLAFSLYIGFRRKSRNLALEAATIFFIFEVVLFSGGLALLEIALGYNPGEYLYGLPAQPSFLLLTILGLKGFYKLQESVGFLRPQVRNHHLDKGQL